MTSIHPDGKGPLDIRFKKALTEYGLKGLKLYPHSGFFPDDRRLDGIYEIASATGVPVLIHAGIKAHAYQRMVFNNPIKIDEVAVRFPNLKIVIMHAGYPWVDEALLVAKLNHNVWVDITFLDSLEMVLKEEIIEPVVMKLKKVIGSERIIWGSEGPELGLELFPDEGIERVKKYIARIQGLKGLTAREKDAILGQNATALLQI